MAEYRTVQTGTSPFQFYPSERLVEAITGLPNPIHLSELDRLLLGIINRVLIVTGLLAYRYLESAGSQKISLDDIRACLRRLADNGYLNRLRFQTSAGQSNLQVYTLGELGRQAVESAGRSVLRAGYVDRMDSLHAKRQLAALQFIVAQGYVTEAEHTAFGRLVRDIHDPAGNHLFRPQAVVQTREKTVFVEAVRSSSGSVDELVCKLKRINDTLASGSPLNLTESEGYEVVIVAESHSHMTQLMQELAGKLQGKYSFQLRFTNDQDTFYRNKRLYALPEKRSFDIRFSDKLAGLLGF